MAGGAGVCSMERVHIVPKQSPAMWNGTGRKFIIWLLTFLNITNSFIEYSHIRLQDEYMYVQNKILTKFIGLIEISLTWWVLTNAYLQTRIRAIGKQGRPRSDAT